ncbi:N-acetylglucosamine kinase [Actinomadura macrotermitis]|uniref:N-acetylmuramic acid/N-acetylglucosamine kinase n=1 Tax=Actinomadura macrotermitis TaxID=2585200 RepID=A0A7K0C3G6_9ACTN|nr:N-acetylmuramic acid/N-acetylglucosamine kinase [Actinomadura macrotermitis]
MSGAPLVAVDGGNSKTDVAVLTADGRLLATGRGGAFRPQLDGVGPAVAELAVVVDDALRRAGVRAGEVALLTACLAGADLPEEEAVLEKALLERRWTGSVHVANDTFALLRTGAAAGWGVAVVCGAGINCVGVGPDGALARFPALGRITGDWGGGASLSEAVMWHAVRAEDGRGPGTALAAAAAAHFGLDRATDVALAVHAGTLPERRLLELVPVLLDVADQGDPAAEGIVARQAGEIVLLGVGALRRLGLLETPAEVVLGGGVLRARRPVLMEPVAEGFAREAPHARLVVAEAPPILGAALLALDRHGAPAGAETALRAAYHA